MTNEEIIQRGQLINDETEPAQNTSERVGGVIKGIGQNLADKDTAIAAEAARNGYYQCTVSGTTLAVTAPGFTLPAHGGNIRIKMSAPATGACTLNINSTGPKALLYNGAAVSSVNTWEQNEIISVFYDPSGSGQYLASNSQGGGGKAEKVSYNNLQSRLAAENVQNAIDELDEDIFNSSHIIKNNIFDWAIAGLPSTNDTSYITPSRTEDGAKWTIKKASPSQRRNGSVKLSGLKFGKKYNIKFDYVSTLTYNAEVCLCKYDKGTAPGNVSISYIDSKRNLDIIQQKTSGKSNFILTYDVNVIPYLAFVFAQPAIGQYLEISNLEVSECKTINDLDIINDSTSNSDLDIVDEQDNILARFYDGHFKTKYFDSKDINDFALATSKFKNKKFAIIGDSISTFAGWLPSDKAGYDGTTYAAYYNSSRGDVTVASRTWWYKTLEFLGITPVKWQNINNCSWSGSRVSGDSDSTTSASAACSERRISDVGIDGFIPDIIIVFISCNDWSNNVPIGTWSVSDSIPAGGTINELRASYALMLHKLHENYPAARIFCCTNLDDPRRDKVSGWPSNNNNGVTTHQWNQNIKEIAEAFGCDIIDMHACGINYQNFPELAVDEGTHPNATGMILMAKKVCAELIAKY